MAFVGRPCVSVHCNKDINLLSVAKPKGKTKRMGKVYAKKSPAA